MVKILWPRVVAYG